MNMFHLPKLPNKKQVGFATFSPRNGFLNVSLIQNPNTAFVEKISEQCFILFNGSIKEKKLINGKEVIVGCWITNIRDFVITSSGHFFQNFEKDNFTVNRTVGELLDLLAKDKKSKEIFGEGNEYSKLLKHTEIKKIVIRVV